MEAHELDGILGQIFLTPEGKVDPYPGYAAVRESTPLHRSSFGMLVAARYEDCQHVLRDQRFGHAQHPPGAMFGITEEEFRARFPRTEERAEVMLQMNPPDHTRLRGLVAKAFTPKTVEALRPRIRELADELLDPLDGEVDVIPALALKLPITVIGEMLGVPQYDHATLLPPIRVLIRALGPLQQDLDSFTEVYDSMNEVDDYFQGLIKHKRDNPAADLLTELIQVEDAGDQLTESELLSTIMLLFVAGYETTTNLIGNGLRALLLHPAQLQRLRDDRALVKRAVEEMLRWDSPVQMTARVVLDDAEVGGEPVTKGEEVITLLGAANRDPRVFDDPDTFDVGRTGPAPISFSSGIHYCLGAALARAEGQVVFESVLDRYRTIEPAWSEDDAPRYRDALILRGLDALPVRLLA